MKKKLIYLFLATFCSLFFTLDVSALNWVNNNGAKNCNNDPFDDSSGQKRIPSTINLNATPSGSTPCEFHGYYSGEWYPSSSTWFDTGTGTTGNHFECPDMGYASQITYNGANTKYRVFCKYRDDTPPSIPADIIGYGPVDNKRLAMSAETFYIDISSGTGSNISLVQGYFEDANANNVYYPVESNADTNPLNTARLRVDDWDLSFVDNDGSPNNGKRLYKVFLSYISDEAGNFIGTLNDNNPSNALISYDYNVFANTTHLTGGSSTKTANLGSLSDSNNVADNTVKNVGISLFDNFGNRIIPVADISREINFRFDIDNYIRRNQYNNNGTDSALYVDTNYRNVAIGSSPSVDFDNEPSTSGNYTIPFYIFAPTYHNNSLVPGNANVNSIEVSTTGSGAVSSITLDSSSASITAKPLYTTQYTGDLINVGFIEGILQDSDLVITKDAGSTAGVSSPSIQMEFGTGSSNAINPDYNLEVGGTTLLEGNRSWAANAPTRIVTNFTSPLDVKTRMIQEGTVLGEDHSYLASIVKYNINVNGTGRNIIYPGHVIGKDMYHGSVVGGVNSYQTGIKITGNTTSQNTGELTSGQFNKDVHIIGKFTKSTQRKQIEQNVYKTIRYIDPKTSGGLTLGTGDLDDADWSASKFNGEPTDSSRGVSIFGERVLYFGDLGDDYVEITGANDVVGTKTIVVENGNVYISGDIDNADKVGILGIIVLGGNVYIDPSVTDIHAVIYTNKSIMSAIDNNSDGDILTAEGDIIYDGANTTSSDLQNQLYIYGALFSENTLGGSRETPAICPYYETATCDLNLSQKYDLNYLRRYYVYDSGSGYDVDTDGDTMPDKNKSGQLSQGAINDYTLREYPVIVDYNPLVQQTPPPFLD